MRAVIVQGRADTQEKLKGITEIVSVVAIESVRAIYLFANDCDQHVSPVRRAPMLEQENALPSSELHSPIDNRHRLAGPRQDHADVRWHIVAALGTMPEVIGVLRH